MNVDALRTGTSVGRYRLDELLSRGGMGEVWRAHDSTLGRPVAVKLLHAGVSDAADRERFVREARSAAQLNNPHVVAIFDVGEWSGRPFLVMELLDGRTLAEDLELRGPLPVDDVRDLGAQAATGLLAAHTAGVVHRDVKPSNLVRTSTGRLKVVDFGIARVLDEASTRLTRTGTVVGTAAYLAPEQARGLSADARTDLYALGCVLYQLLSGRAPFTGGPTEVLYAHLHTEPAPLSSLRSDVPHDLETLVHGLLAKDPRDRPQDAAVVRAALLGDAAALTEIVPAAADWPTEPDAPEEAWGATRAMPAADEARTQGVPPSDGRPGRGSGRGWLVAAAVIAAGLVAVALLAWWVQDQRTPAGAATDRTTDQTSASDRPTKTRSQTPTPTPTPTPARFGSERWLQQLDAELARLADSGAMDPDVADHLRDKIADVLDADRPSKRLRNLRELRDDLEKAAEDDELPMDGLLGGLLDGGALLDLGGDGDQGDGTQDDGTIQDGDGNDNKGKGDGNGRGRH